MEKNSKILVTGAAGLVGSAVVRQLKKEGYSNIITLTRDLLTERGIEYAHFFDIRRLEQIHDVFYQFRPEYVINAAAKVGGIHANNTKSAEFIMDNMLIQNNIIECCHKYEVKKLLFLGSSCIYPKLCPQPIKEEYLLTSALEETNIGYAIAKISGLMACRLYNKQYGDKYISAMPTNLYGPNDNFNLQDSHVLPALLRKFHEAKVEGKSEVQMWGTGNAKREFLYIDDLAEALVFLMNNYEDYQEHINVGTGIDVSIKELAETIKEIVGFEGSITWDASKPDGTPRKLLDTSKINKLGWAPSTGLHRGIRQTYKWFEENYDTIRK